MDGTEDSILITIKKMLGLESEYTPFDQDIIILINSNLMTLTQNNVGPSGGFRIKGSQECWGDFLVNPVMLESAKEYIYLKVKMVFDPPGNSFVMDAYKQQAEEFLVRLQMQAESAEDFYFVESGRNPRL